MNLKQAFQHAKKYLVMSDQELADDLGVSRLQVVKIRQGYTEGITAKLLLRFSKYFRISIDELLENRFLPPSYHFPMEIHSVFIKAPEDYPDFFIKKEDTLYIRPFIHDENKQGDLIVLEDNGRLIVDIYQGLDHPTNQRILYHIVGISRTPAKELAHLRSYRAINKPSRPGRPVKVVFDNDHPS